MSGQVIMADVWFGLWSSMNGRSPKQNRYGTATYVASSTKSTP
jgi:hypothetical protein